MAQVRLSLVAPHQIAGGSFDMDLESSVFGPIPAVDVFSATGDQAVVAFFRDRQVDVRFRPPSGGIERLPGMPAIIVMLPVEFAFRDDSGTSQTHDCGGEADKCQ
jgi:hypothetical protein